MNLRLFLAQDGAYRQPVHDPDQLSPEGMLATVAVLLLVIIVLRRWYFRWNDRQNFKVLQEFYGAALVVRDAAKLEELRQSLRTLMREQEWSRELWYAANSSVFRQTDEQLRLIFRCYPLTPLCAPPLTTRLYRASDDQWKTDRLIGLRIVKEVPCILTADHPDPVPLADFLAARGAAPILQLTFARDDDALPGWE